MDFTGRNLSDCKDMNDQHIVGSCFSQEKPDSHVFPEDMTGVTFENCNLDNCIIPGGSIVSKCLTRRFERQIDGEDWIIDENGKPVAPLNPVDHVRRGKEADPTRAFPIDGGEIGIG